MRLGCIQFDVQRDPAENLRRIEAQLSWFRGGLAVLPELCTCGYLFPDREALFRAAEPVPEGPTVQWLLALSKFYDCALLFGLPERDGAQIFNTAAAVDRGVFAGKYRKLHLSDLEKRLFAPGERNGVLTVGGVKVGVQICFDLWFPEVSREQLALGAELFCVPANFGGEQTAQIAPVRAMENLTPLALCNRIGRETLPNITADFLGKSAVYDGGGQPLEQAAAGADAAFCTEVSIGRPRANVICGDFPGEIARHPLL